MDRDRLVTELIEAFDADPDVARVVARQAGDLADSGRYDADAEAALSVAIVIENLRDAPTEFDLVERWNWWMGVLSLAYGEYDQFHVRRDSL